MPNRLDWTTAPRRIGGLGAALLALALVAACTGGRSSHTAAGTTSAPATAIGTAGAPTATARLPSHPSSSSALGVPTIQPIKFSNCTGQFQTAIGGARAAEMTFGCAKLPVPLDYSRPAGASTDLFLVKVHSTRQVGSNRIGSLVVNPGGPGASGVNLAAGLVDELSDSIFSRFDVVGFDPRGVGLSSPLTCISDKAKDAYTLADPDMTTAAGRTQARAASAAVVAGCVSKYRAGLSHYNTDETARDLDLVRQAVGDAKLTYLGYSYGTRLGAVYAHEFPSNVRAAVLDGAENPTASVLSLDEGYARGFEAAFDQFAADCVKRPACAVLANPRAFVERLVRSADRAPLRSSLAGETRHATGGVVTAAVMTALYDQSLWIPLGQALVAARQGDAKPLFALADQYTGRDASGHYSNLLDLNLVVTCNDSTFRPTDELIAATALSWKAKYPIFGNNAVAGLYNCVGWPQSGHPLPPARAIGTPPILVIGTVHDPATPYAGTVVLARALGTGVVLSWDGQGHTAYPKTPCVVAKVDSYLITANAPTGASCPAGP